MAASRVNVGNKLFSQRCRFSMLGLSNRDVRKLSFDLAYQTSVGFGIC